MNKSAYLLAEVALEVASHLKDEHLKVSRAEWRHMVVNRAIYIIDTEYIDDATTDIDEIVAGAMWGKPYNETT